LTRRATPSSTVPSSSRLLSSPSAGATVSVKRRSQLTPVCYTGGGPVGKIVAGAAAKTLTPTTLELGGKSPTIVCSDANLQIAARRMISIKQMNVGQMCGESLSR
jgi:acyl-CoA reductase-like NAD-dependent aldehyde dehydrogenase